MPVIVQLALDPDVADEAWKLYDIVFDEINRLAATKHKVSQGEFKEICANEDLFKYLALDKAGEMVGMAVLTNNLAAWPMLSPEFFERRYPDHYQRGLIWYVGFVGTRPNNSHAFRELLYAMFARTGKSGMVGMDYCDYNKLERRLPEVTQLLMGRHDPDCETELVDSQTMYMLHFDGGSWSTPAEERGAA